MALRDALPLLIPLIAIQFGLQVYGFFDLARDGRVVRGGNKFVWVLAILLGGLFGSIAYLIAGRREL
jgi:hypothetical protein